MERAPTIATKLTPIDDFQTIKKINSLTRNLIIGDKDEMIPESRLKTIDMGLTDFFDYPDKTLIVLRKLNMTPQSLQDIK